MLNSPQTTSDTHFLPWVILLSGLVAVYVPSFVDLFRGPWSSEKNAHGPIVMAVTFLFLYYRMRQMLERDALLSRPAPVAGFLAVGVGLLMFALGRSQGVLLLEIGSLTFVLTGIVLAFFGTRAWRHLWFVFFFMLFMIPLPASLVDMVTLPLKISVSFATEHLLYWLGYPIARSGVILMIGPYQLLVADACAGLNSLFTLEALGLLYMNLVRHPSVLRNILLAALIMPISFAANTLRIVFLALITFYEGDAAGQGFIHGLSSLVLFLSALLLIIAVDTALSWLVAKSTDMPESRAGEPIPTSRPASLHTKPSLFKLPTRQTFAMSLAMLGSVALANFLTPEMTSAKPMTSLSNGVPRQFGEWREVQPSLAQANLSIAGTAVKKDADQPYDDILLRTYVNSKGEQIMLALAYAKEQRQDVKIHLPEICYPAQGYDIATLSTVSMAVLPKGQTLPGKQLLTRGNNRIEAVSYWVRIGNAYPQGGLATRIKIFRDGLNGIMADGMLVRASTVISNSADAGSAFALQENFLTQLVSVAAPSAPALVALKS